MRLRYRLLSVILVFLMTINCMVFAFRFQTRVAQGNEASLRGDAFSAIEDAFNDTATLRLWYTDPSLTEYLNSRAVLWHELNPDARLRIELVSGIEYLEQIQKASTERAQNAPDLFLVTHDTLEKAYLAGLASAVTEYGEALDATGYPKAAIDAVSFRGEQIAYPFYFETASLVYNRTYLENAAKDALEDEALQDGVALVNGEVPLEQSAIDERVETYLPHTISDIMTFADSYNAPEEVVSVFTWDVNDIFNNYFFVGNYIDVGGPSGDDLAKISIYNTEAIRCLQVYQQLNQFFAIDAEEVSYEKIISEFIEGKMVFTVATTDVLKKIEEAKNTGSCPYEFATAFIPDLTSELESRTMSVTNCVVVNGYTEKRELAHELARFLSTDATDAMYLLSGKVPAYYGQLYKTNPDITTFVDVYADSVPVSKMIETSNFWVYLEIAFTEIWNGEDANDTLRHLSEQIMTQIAGEEYVELRLPDPPRDEVEETEED